MKSLILVKHSTPAIVENIPAHEWHLSDEGRARAGKFAEQLTRYRPGIIVSSVEPKAMQTAEIISRKLDISFQAIKGLHEHDRSESPYYSMEEFQNLVQRFFEKPDALVFGKEAANQALARFHETVDGIFKKHHDKSILIVAHGTVISLFVSFITGCNGYDLWRDLWLPACVALDVKSKTILEIVNLP